MRELKDYFCNFEQSQEIKQLGFDEQTFYAYAKFGAIYARLGKNSNIDGGSISAPLRSQALDYFMELGWDFQIVRHLTKGYWFACAIKGCGYALPNFIKEYHEAESALIDKLIELEKEARNGN